MTYKKSKGGWKLGSKVALYWDGKWGRRVEGVITKTHRGNAITVRFVPLHDDPPIEVECKFRRKNGSWRRSTRHFFGGYGTDQDGSPQGWYNINKWIPPDRYPVW